MSRKDIWLLKFIITSFEEQINVCLKIIIKKNLPLLKENKILTIILIVGVVKIMISEQKYLVNLKK